MSTVAAHPQTSASVRKLYRHALESIFAFASLADLHALTAVCRDWSAAVTTMPPIHAANRMGDSFDRQRLNHGRPLQPTDFPALRSRLARHVSSLGVFNFLATVDCLEAVAHHMPWMRSLFITLGVHSKLFIRLGMQPDPELRPRTLISALGRLQSLTNLDAHFEHGLDAWDADAFDSLIAAIGGMPMLESVRLQLPPHVFPLLSFAPLSALPSLRTLSVESSDLSFRLRSLCSPGDNFPPCTDSQIAEFRSMRSLKKLAVETAQTAFLERMLQPGHALQWTQLPRGADVTEPLAALLGSLSTLTRLHVTMQCPNVSFLSQLPQLTDIGIYESPQSTSPVDPDELVHALSHGSQIRMLKLTELQLSDVHLAQLLPCFPKLASLSLEFLPAVESLRCLDTLALAASLTQLSLETLSGCPSSEVVHLLHLRALNSLCITGLASPVSADLKAQFVVPSQRFPFLHVQPNKVRFPEPWQEPVSA